MENYKKEIKDGLETNAFSIDQVLPLRKIQDNPIYAVLIESMDDAMISFSVLRRFKYRGKYNHYFYLR